MSKTVRPYILAENNYKDVKKAKYDLVVLPWGATEAHNYHMPYATDVYEADAIAAEGARKAHERGAKVTVLPTIPFGVNTGQTDIHLDINMYPSTQMAILNDVIEVLDRQGYYKLLVLNSHGGNDFKTMLRELGVKYPKMFLSTCNWFQSLDKTQYFEEMGDHADEMETSLMMYLKPELIRPLKEAGLGKDKKAKIKAFNEKWAWAERRWSQVTKDTGIGNPKKSTAKKGKKFFTDATDKMGDLMYDLCKIDVSKFYK